MSRPVPPQHLGAHAPHQPQLVQRRLALVGVQAALAAVTGAGLQDLERPLVEDDPAALDLAGQVVAGGRPGNRGRCCSGRPGRRSTPGGPSDRSSPTAAAALLEVPLLALLLLVAARSPGPGAPRPRRRPPRPGARCRRRLALPGRAVSSVGKAGSPTQVRSGRSKASSWRVALASFSGRRYSVTRWAPSRRVSMSPLQLAPGTGSAMRNTGRQGPLARASPTSSISMPAAVGAPAHLEAQQGREARLAAAQVRPAVARDHGQLDHVEAGQLVALLAQVPGLPLDARVAGAHALADGVLGEALPDPLHHRRPRLRPAARPSRRTAAQPMRGAAPPSSRAAARDPSRRPEKSAVLRDTSFKG